MTKEQRSLLSRRLREAMGQQPEIRLLRTLLLELGGVELVAPDGFDSDIPSLILHGSEITGQVNFKVMQRSACHENVARLWLKRNTLVAIGTGYALSDDGLWRQHSWGLRKHGILETTKLRVKYFGIALKGRRADLFGELNG